MVVEALEKIVGIKNFINLTNGAEGMEEYLKDLSFVNRIKPRCVVKPQSAGEVQALIKWANDNLIPLVSISSGPPHFRGDTVPSIGGAVIVDLSEMNKIIRVDRRNRIVMIEPGVTFTELIPRLEQEGIRLNMPLLPRKTKSVIGSMLEREPVIMPLYQWDATDPLTCIEVIFGTGDLFRTGSAAGPGTLEEQWAVKQAQVMPMGPGQTDFARVVQGSQGTIGIVTWSTVRCELLPSLQKPFLVGSQNYEKLSEFTYRLLWLKIVDECLFLNSSSLAAILARNPAEYNSLRIALPPWVLFFCLAGYKYFPEERLAYQEQEMIKDAQRLSIEPGSSISGVSANEVLRMLAKPAEEPYWKLRYKGGFQDIFFLTTLDRVPVFVEVMYDIATQYGYASSDISIYVQPMVQGTSCHCEFNLFYDPTHAKETAKIRELYIKASEALMNAGAFFSRPYGTVVDMVYRRDAETTAALRKVKPIFDPNNIMNPGKLCF